MSIGQGSGLQVRGELDKFYKTFPRADGFFIGVFDVTSPQYETITVSGFLDVSDVWPGDGLELTLDYAGQDKFKRNVSSYKITSMRRWFPSKSVLMAFLKTRAPRFDVSIQANLDMIDKAWAACGSDIILSATDPVQFRSRTGLDVASTEKIAAALGHRTVESELKDMLPGIYPSMLLRIVNKFHADAVLAIRADPYCLLYHFAGEYGFSFRRIDQWALGMGVAPDNPKRLTAAVRFAVRDLLLHGDWASNTSGGHVCVPCNDPGWFNLIWSRLGEYLGPCMDQAAVMDILQSGEAGLELVDFSQQVWLYDSGLRKCEAGAAGILKNLNNQAPVCGLSGKEIRDGLADYSKTYGMTPTTSQMIAVMTALSNRVSVITGGPGSGKTTTMAALIYVWARNAAKHGYERDVILVAPTGMAVRNLLKSADNLGLKDFNPTYRTIASCIIGLHSKEQKRRDHALNQFRQGLGQLVIMDETSMVSLSDLYAFLRTVPYAQIVFVGDPDQLPAIDPGDAFMNMAYSNVIPMAALTGNNRVAKTSRALAVNSGLVQEGKPLKDLTTDPEVFEFMPYATDSDDFYVRACGIVMDRVRSGSDLREIAVLSPTRSVVSHVNRLLQDMLNPVAQDHGRSFTLNHESGMVYRSSGHEAHELKAYDVRDKAKHCMRVGDRVVITRNMELDSGGRVVNGDRGVLTAYFVPDDFNGRDSFTSACVLLDSSGQEVWLCGDGTEDDPLTGMALSYATTVHKSQGCEFDHVVLLLNYMARPNPGFLNRSLLYTAMTRAKRDLTVLGPEQSFDMMSASPRPGRWSLFGQRLAGML